MRAAAAALHEMGFGLNTFLLTMLSEEVSVQLPWVQQ